MASGSDKRQRPSQILVRLTEEELAALDAKADRAGMPRAAFLRAAALDSAGPRAKRRPPVDQVALRQLLGELGRIGNNLNQLTRAANTGIDLDHAALKSSLKAISDMRAAVIAALALKTPAEGPEPNTKPATSPPPTAPGRKREGGA